MYSVLGVVKTESLTTFLLFLYLPLLKQYYVTALNIDQTFYMSTVDVI